MGERANVYSVPRPSPQAHQEALDFGLQRVLDGIELYIESAT